MHVRPSGTRTNNLYIHAKSVKYCLHETLYTTEDIKDHFNLNLGKNKQFLVTACFAKQMSEPFLGKKGLIVFKKP